MVRGRRMLDAFSYAFMQRAFLAGMLVALLAGYFGPFIVQRRLAFLGHGLAHAAFGGVALGLLLGLSPMLVAVPYTVLVALGIVAVRQRTPLATDTVIGVLFSLSMALGILFLTWKEGYAGDAFAYLFGSILSVSGNDLMVTGCVTVLALFTLPLWPRWAYATFDRQLAKADRIPVTLDDTLITVAIAIVVVVSMKVTGILLISAFLVLPPACARLVAPTFFSMSVVSVAIAVFTVLGGLIGSYYADLPSGPAIILLQGAVFGGLLLAGVHKRN